MRVRACVCAHVRVRVCVCVCVCVNTAYDKAIKSIVTKDDNIKCKDLLFAPPFNVKINKYHEITQITRN